MSGEEIVALCQKAQGGDEEALEAMLLAFQPLVESMARKKYNNWPFPTPLTEDDLISAGTEALWRAVMGYNPSKGTFYAWAKRCIYNAMQRTLNDLGTPVRTPVSWEAADAPNLFYADILDGTECVSDLPDLHTAEICAIVQEVLNTTLDAQERRIVQETFGFLGPSQSLRQQAGIIARTHARVGQILAAALSKLEADPRMQQAAALL